MKEYREEQLGEDETPRRRGAAHILNLLLAYLPTLLAVVVQVGLLAVAVRSWQVLGQAEKLWSEREASSTPKAALKPGDVPPPAPQPHDSAASHAPDSAVEKLGRLTGELQNRVDRWPHHQGFPFSNLGNGPEQSEKPPVGLVLGESAGKQTWLRRALFPLLPTIRGRWGLVHLNAKGDLISTLAIGSHQNDKLSEGIFRAVPSTSNPMPSLPADCRLLLILGPTEVELKPHPKSLNQVAGADALLIGTKPESVSVWPEYCAARGGLTVPIPPEDESVFKAAISRLLDLQNPSQSP